MNKATYFREIDGSLSELHSLGFVIHVHVHA